jgi:MFS family permease
MAKAQAAKFILWGPVWALALVQGAITLMWVIYGLYLTDLLTALGFPKGLALGLLVGENLLGMVSEPLMGTLSDQVQHRVGTRLPIVSLGAVLAAGLFGVIPTALLWGEGALRWGLPLLLVAWALAMTVFRSPALSLLGRYAVGTHLPQAASILTLVGALAGGMGPVANQWILALGPWAAFGAGSAILLVATIALRQTQPSAPSPSDRPDEPSDEPIFWPGLGLVFGAGAGVALGFRLTMTALPMAIAQRMPDGGTNVVLAALFLTLALTAIPAGRLATRLGNRRSMVLGLGILAALAFLVGLLPSLALGVALATLFGAAFSLVSNGTLPFALGMVPPAKAGLGTGLYFSGGALAASLVGLWLGGDGLSLAASSLGSALAFLAAAVCVFFSDRLGVAKP